MHGLIMGLVVGAKETDNGSGAGGPEGDRAIEHPSLSLSEGRLASQMQRRAARAQGEG